MAHLQRRKTKDGKTRYRVQVRLRGHPPQSATFERRTDAKKWAQQTEAAIREGRYFKSTEARKHTFADVADRYLRDVMPTKPKSEHKQTAQLLWWKERLGHYCLADINAALIAECRDSLRNEKTRLGRKRSGATVNRYLAILSHAFTYAVKEREWVQSNPVSKVSRLKEPRGRVRFLDEQELACLLNACRNSDNPTSTRWWYSLCQRACGAGRYEISRGGTSTSTALASCYTKPRTTTGAACRSEPSRSRSSRTTWKSHVSTATCCSLPGMESNPRK